MNKDFPDFDDEPFDDGSLSSATVAAIRAGSSSIPDVEAAERLLEQVAGTMVAVATGGPRIEDVKARYGREYWALAAVLKRLKIKNPNPHSDLWTWYGKWTSDLGGWASRRAYIADMYAPVRDALETAVDRERELATGASDGPTGWSEVDAKLGVLRSRVRAMNDTDDDAKAVGLQCISVLEALGRACFNADRHLPPGVEVPHKNDAKRRLGYFVEGVASGDRFEHVRPIIQAAWKQAQAVKHRDTPNRTDAGIAADSVALLVTIIRRLADEEVAAAREDDASFGAGWD